MNFFNLFSSSDKAIDNVFDKDTGLLTQVGNWVGGQQYTSEEIAETNERLRGAVVDYAKTTMSENSERSKARRQVAIMWIKVQLWLVLFCAITIPFDTAIANQYFQLATSTLMMAGTGAIITFFFGSYMLARHNESKVK
jgi:hypothetical protein